MWPFNTRHAKTVLLILSAIGPIAAATVILAGGQRWSLPDSKLLLLGSEYFCMLPLLILALGYGRRWPAFRTEFRTARYRWLGLALVAFAAILIPLAGFLQLGRYQGDESAYLFQARCLNVGRLSAPQLPNLPPETLGFAHHVHLNGQWMGKYPPGWPLLLASMTMLKLEWLLNPLLGVILIVLTYRAGKDALGKAEAITAAGMMAVSGFLVLNCLGFMSHVLSGVLTAAAFLSLVRLTNASEAAWRHRWIFLMFVSLAATELVRPFSGMCVGVALIVCWQARAERRLTGLFGWLILFGLVTGAVLGLENYLVTGNALISAYSAYGNGHLSEVSLKPAELVQSLLFATPVRLVDTFSVSFPLLPPLALYGLWRFRNNRLMWGACLICAALVLGYAVERENSDSPIGERFYFEAFFAACLMAGAGLVQLARDLRVPSRMRLQTSLVLTVASLSGVVACTHWELALREPSARMARALQAVSGTRTIVFVRGTEMFPAFNWNFNDPSSGTLELIDPGSDQARQSIAQSAGYKHWALLSYDTKTNSPVWSGPRK